MPFEQDDELREARIVRKMCYMKNRTFLAAILVMMLANTAIAQQIAGNWQGILKPGSQDLRLLLQVVKNPDSSWRATLLNMGKSMDSVPVKITLKDLTLKLSIDAMQATYQGKLSADETALNGIWIQTGGTPQALNFQHVTKETAWQHIEYVAVDKDVTLEVIDWGGVGRPLILLTGLGNTARIFDSLATKLASNYHVYGITRRGFGISSVPESGYSADRLGDDVMAVMQALELEKPVIAGHSIAGEELSSIGSRHPEKVAGLIYLEAAYGYAFYDPAEGEFSIDLAVLRKKLDTLQRTGIAGDGKRLIQEVLQTDFPLVRKHLSVLLKAAEAAPPPPASSVSRVVSEIASGEQKYLEIKTPLLAICAGTENCEKQKKIVQNSAPSSKFIIMPTANHYVFFSNESDVLREMKAFVAGLP
jgi:non-heme chloroperoxidase